MASQIVPVAQVPATTQLTTDQVELLKRTICKGATDDELQMFVSTAQRLRLDPFARQIFAVKRYDSAEKREVMSLQVSIDGLRLVAERTGNYEGQVGPLWCGRDGEWKDVWLEEEPPVAARVGVLRHGWREPCWAVATWRTYCQKKKDGTSTRMWAEKSDLMLAKCAEALALRKAFPMDLAGVYAPEELEATEHSPVTSYEPPVAPTEAPPVASLPTPTGGADVVSPALAVFSALEQAISEASTKEELKELTPRIKEQPKDVQELLRPLYTVRSRELS